jgi:hypothetical protein
MDLLIITSVNLMWIVYSMTEGIRQAFFDYFKNFNKRKCNYKIWKTFLFHRILVVFSLFLVMFPHLGYYSFLFTIGNVLMFRFFHKITYNKMVQKLDRDIFEEIDVPDITIFEKMDKHRNIMLYTGIVIQVLVYFLAL